MQVIELFDAGCARNPEQIAFIEGDRSVSFAQAKRITEQLAQALLGAGIAPGSHVAVYARNGIEPFLCVLALLRAGMVWLPINPLEGEASNKRLLQRLDCTLLWAQPGFEITASEGQSVWKLDISSLDELVALHARGQTMPQVSDNAMAAIFATGGTTGEPKGVMTSHANFTAFCTHRESAVETSLGVFLAAAPMTHVTGRLALAALYWGDTVVVIPRAEPALVLDAVERYRVTDIFLPPTVIYRLMDLLDTQPRDLSSVKQLSYGAAPILVSQLKRALKLFGPVMTQGYGQTEAPMHMARLSPEDHYQNGQIADDKRLSSCGKATGAAELAIMDTQGKLLPAGEVGEVVVRGGIVMQGYYKNPEATAAASRFGWHHTGDLGWLDAEGFLHIVDRLKDMIISGGFNVYAAEVEQALMSNADVQDCAVFGIPDPDWGEAVIAAVMPKANIAIDTGLLKSQVKQQLGAIKTPKHIHLLDALPRNPAGKVLKRVLRERFQPSKETSL
ncbi:AMP-binding protein [Variovorax sp. PCZ-1]|uniref:class I adenylate-forming enzyme family protein n=1 Tax=Variovorax sp. PCZ-1 TaxID=2835533 RepID=UPI001BD0073C|nr:AMP-binding protein [Variovorax sp. PCZ-1]MBS7806074.1 AMP-binding protein [Variovorax sp. PCZ-1]